MRPCGTPPHGIERLRLLGLAVMVYHQVMALPIRSVLSSDEARRATVAQVLFWGTWAVVALGVLPMFLVAPEKTEWAWVYRRAALRMRAGEAVNVVEPVAYAYPPAMALLTVPLSELPVRWGAFSWWVINAGALAWLMYGCLSLCGVPWPASLLSGRWAIVFLAAVLLNLRFTIAPLQHQQFDLVIAALVVGGCHALAENHRITAGLRLGAAAAMKCTPLLFLPWLLWRRQWSAALALAAAAIGLNLMPDVLFPQQAGRLYLADWWRSFVAPSANRGPGEWFTAPSQNQSLAGLVDRWFDRACPTPQSPTSDSAELGASNTDESSANPADVARSGYSAPAVSRNILRAVVYGLDALLVLVTMVVYRRPGQPLGAVPAAAMRPEVNSTSAAANALSVNRPRNAEVFRATLQWPIESSAVCCLMLLLSPMTGKAHFVLMLLPCFVLFRVAIIDADRRLWPVLALMAFSGPLTTKGIWGSQWGGLLLDWGVPTLYLLLGLLGCWMAVRYIDRPLKGDCGQ